MKALSLHQPWATWIATGAKSIETRTRPVSYRGPLLICSTKRPPEATDPGYTRPDEFPLGVAVAVAELVDVKPHRAQHSANSLVPYDPDETLYSYVLVNIRAIPEPVKVRGFPGLFDPPADVIAAVEAQDLTPTGRAARDA